MRGVPSRENCNYVMIRSGDYNKEEDDQNRSDDDNLENDDNQIR